MIQSEFATRHMAVHIIAQTVDRGNPPLHAGLVPLHCAGGPAQPALIPPGHKAEAPQSTYHPVSAAPLALLQPPIAGF